ncbi:hypothetical protein FNV43_RR04820 [Rhamnella rubrinervis]|uniref:Uncharacterized protein n=1 Tax=Rhamnella rubrinervis TaxID=2594499 RepID=A0A8K0MQN2_9ROSA|nr:hypothetical protein FNV43_RR04820 [Rhamnella rubrinervis]
MAAYDAYGYRGGPRADREWNKYYDDNVSRPVIVDGDGRIISRSPYHDTANTYVVESEIVEHVYAPRLTDTYKHSPPRNDKWRRPSTTPPPELDDFLNQVQIEVSRPHDKKYSTSVPPRTGYGGGGYGHDYKPTVNYPVRDYDDYDDYYQKKDRPTGDWNRPVNHATRPTRDSNKLGLPTNKIEEAVDYLKGAASKLSPVTAKHHQPQPARLASPVLRQESEEAARRYDYNYDKPEEAARRYDYNYDKPEEAARKYDYNYNNNNHQSSSPWTRTTVPQTTGPTTTTRIPGVIDSNEAARRFNGKIVRL